LKVKNADIMKTLSFFIIALLCFSSSCSSKESKNMENKTIVRIETTYGNIDVILYDETPAHRDNFIKLINEGFYNDLLFHRVINNFMIQSGDPDTKNALPGMQFGTGGPGYTIPPEIHSHLFHKKGALAAARLDDDVNSERNSSGSQFYIVHGTLFDDAQLDELEARTNYQKKQEFASKLFRELEREYIDKDIQPDYQEISERVKKIAPDHFNENTLFKFSDEQREIYKTTGGTPHLDGAYTVFGETIDGYDVIDKIASVETGAASRPVNNVKMKTDNHIKQINYRSMPTMQDKIDKALKEALEFKVENKADLEQFRIRFLGKKGIIAQLFDDFKNLPHSDEKRDTGTAS
jgi:cyclophilin family peptidyl-prolyl cis-trans isomerase